MRFWNNYKKYGILTAAAMAVCLLTGCEKGIPIVSSSRENYDYPRAQAMIVVATERNRYEKVYTDQIWDVEVEPGKDFEQYLLEQVQSFLKDLKTMNLLAENQAVELNSGERDKIRKLSETYFQGLTEGDIQYMGVSLADVEAMYEEYHVANKLVEELTQEMDLEVSDSEAKVVTVVQAVFDDRESAEAVAAAVREGKDFQETVQKAGEIKTETLEVGRGQLTEALDEAVFALADGECSAVVESEGSYYVFHCVSDYEVEATKERKAQLYEERKNQAFGRIYAGFQSEHEIKLTDPLWSELDFLETDDTSADNFFALYQEEFAGKSY